MKNKIIDSFFKSGKREVIGEVKTR